MVHLIFYDSGEVVAGERRVEVYSLDARYAPSAPSAQPRKEASHIPTCFAHTPFSGMLEHLLSHRFRVLLGDLNQ